MYRDYEFWLYYNVTAVVFGPVIILLIAVLGVLYDDPSPNELLLTLTLPTLVSVCSYLWVKHYFYKQIEERIEAYVNRGGHPHIVLCFFRAFIVMFAILGTYTVTFGWIPFQLLAEAGE
jgi:hypothetical protein